MDESKIDLETDDKKFVQQALNEGLSCIIMCINNKFAAAITF